MSEKKIFQKDIKNILFQIDISKNVISKIY
jgi:hypothetical protein